VQIGFGPVTSSLRVYDLLWKSNLLDSTPWTPLNLNVPGNYDRSPMWISIDPVAKQGYYRNEVKLP